MIQKHIKDLLEREIPGLEWSIEYYTGSDNTGTVISNNPRSSEVDDERDLLFPSYQAYLRSSDFSIVLKKADKI